MTEYRKTEENIKRLGIFVFYDKQGVIDRYVEYLLEEIQKSLSHMVIVCNGVIEKEGFEKLRKFTNEVYVRENKGFDAMAYKLAMTDYLGWEEVEKYDEVLLFNDTFYGPIYPFEEMFAKMQNEDCDFWGITYEKCFKDYMFGTDDIIPTHVHSYFCVFRKAAIESTAFQNYWNAFDSTEWFFSDVCRHEQQFTQVLENSGLHWSTYVKKAVGYDENILATSLTSYYVMAYELIKYYRCPIIKRKNFIIKNLSTRTGTGGEDTTRAFQYIQDETAYNEDFIWENILRLYNIYEIKNAMHLNYVLPWEISLRTKQKIENVAIVICVPDSDRIDIVKNEYLNSISCEVNVVIVSSAREWKLHIQQLDKKYRYLGLIVLQEEKNNEPPTIVESTNYNILENTVKSIEYIQNIINLFEKNMRLGLLTVPHSLHAYHLGELNDLWEEKYDAVVDLSKQLALRANISFDIPCLSKEIAFWCRREALTPLLSRDVDAAFDIVAMICPYIAQSLGYYTSEVMNTNYASLQATNLFYCLMGTVKKCSGIKEFTDYKSLFEADVESIVEGYKYAVIYGAGANGIKLSNMFKKKGVPLQGFMISDDQPRQEEKNGFPIYRLSEFPYAKEDTMIIVAVAYARSRNAIVQNIIDNGYKHYYLL